MRKIDWGYYTKLLVWEKRVACALSLNKDPESFERDYRNDGSSAGADNRRKFDQRMELLSQAIASEQVFSAPFPGMRYPLEVRPAEFAKWAHGLGLSLPAELMRLIPATVAADAEPVPAPEPVPGNAALQPLAGTNRRNLLDPVIDEAISKAGGSNDAAAIYVHLRDMALNGQSPFTTADESGLVYTDRRNKTRSLTIKQLRDRLRRRGD